MAEILLKRIKKVSEDVINDVTLRRVSPMASA
jgi:hypothetical protein